MKYFKLISGCLLVGFLSSCSLFQGGSSPLFGNGNGNSAIPGNGPNSSYGSSQNYRRKHVARPRPYSVNATDQAKYESLSDRINQRVAKTKNEPVPATADPAMPSSTDSNLNAPSTMPSTDANASANVSSESNNQGGNFNSN